MPSRGLAARHAVTRTTESPDRTTTEPPACLASFPVSMVMVRLPRVMERVRMFIKFKEKTEKLKGKLKSRTTEALLPSAFFLLTSFPDVQALDEIRIALRILGPEIVE